MGKSSLAPIPAMLYPERDLHLVFYKPMKTRTITAILDAGTLKGKIKTPLLREITILLHMTKLNCSLTEGLTPDDKASYRRLVFEWRMQVGMRIHLYKLKEIL